MLGCGDSSSSGGCADGQVPSSLLVASGDSDASYLMNKLLGVEMALGTTRMPRPDPDGLCTPKIEAIRQWIDDGAPVTPAN